MLVVCPAEKSCRISGDLGHIIMDDVSKVEELNELMLTKKYEGIPQSKLERYTELNVENFENVVNSLLEDNEDFKSLKVSKLADEMYEIVVDTPTGEIDYVGDFSLSPQESLEDFSYFLDSWTDGMFRDDVLLSRKDLTMEELSREAEVIKTGKRLHTALSKEDASGIFPQGDDPGYLFLPEKAPHITETFSLEKLKNLTGESAEGSMTLRERKQHMVTKRDVSVYGSVGYINPIIKNDGSLGENFVMSGPNGVGKVYVSLDDLETMEDFYVRAAEELRKKKHFDSEGEYKRREQEVRRKVQTPALYGKPESPYSLVGYADKILSDVKHFDRLEEAFEMKLEVERDATGR